MAILHVKSDGGEAFLVEKSKDLIFLEKLLTIEKVEELQSNIEVKENLSIWKYDFFLKIVAPILTPVAQELLEQSNKTLCGFTSIKLLNHSLPRVSRIRLKCRRQLQQLLKLEVRLYLEKRGSILHCCEDFFQKLAKPSLFKKEQSRLNM